MARITLHDLTKHFDKIQAVEALNLGVADKIHYFDPITGDRLPV